MHRKKIKMRKKYIGKLIKKKSRMKIKIIYLEQLFKKIQMTKIRMIIIILEIILIIIF